MPSRSERHPPIPPISSSGTAANPLRPPPEAGLESSSYNLTRPRDALNMNPMDGSAPKDVYRRGHSRSISNPFAGFGRKRDNTAIKYGNWNSDSDEDDDDGIIPQESLATSPRKAGKRGASANDLLEGKCQTCDATVRWPRHLNVFRCTDCLMVTDLGPEVHESRDLGDKSRKKAQDSQGEPSKLASKGTT